MPQHFSDSRLFSVANTNSELRGGFARTNQIRPMEFPFWEKSLTINRHLLIHTVFHKVFYDILIGWQENWTVGQLQFRSVTQSCLTLCDPMNHSTPGLPVHYQLPELLKLMSIKSVTPCSHLILCRPLLLLLPIPPSIRVFPNESTLRIRRPKYWSFSFSISPSNEHPGLISFRMD